MKTLFQIWLLASLLYWPLPQRCNAQPKTFSHYDANLGLSTADAVNVGILYNFRQNAIGVNVGGGLPDKHFWQVIASISVYRHLWGKSRFTGIMPWYAKGAVHYNYSKSELRPGYVSGTRLAGVRLYMGRDLNISPRLGFTAAAGPLMI